jgi:hypothetical protein
MTEDASSGPKLDRSAFSVSDRFDDDEVRRYWHSRTPAERLAQVEILRRINYGNRATEGIARVIEVVEGFEKRDLDGLPNLP